MREYAAHNGGRQTSRGRDTAQIRIWAQVLLAGNVQRMAFCASSFARFGRLTFDLRVGQAAALALQWRGLSARIAPRWKRLRWKKPRGAKKFEAPAKKVEFIGIFGTNVVCFFFRRLEHLGGG